LIYTLYKTTNLVNKKIYIGVHTTEDIAFGCDSWEDPYIGSGHNIWAALKKYGRDKFQVEIVAYFDEEYYAYDAEKDIVTEEWLTKNKGVCYNINVGGNKPPRNGIPPPTGKGTFWVTDGKNDKRVLELSDGWVVGRSRNNFSEKQRVAVGVANRKRNLENNPMKSLEVRRKMRDTVIAQYANGRRSYNQHTKENKNET
jgi:hypothetical protein